MKVLWMTVLGCTFFALIATSAFPHDGMTPKSVFRLAQTSPKSAECIQQITCGTKNGVRKEYPTPCAARDDGATDISPKVGPTCEPTK